MSLQDAENPDRTSVSTVHRSMRRSWSHPQCIHVLRWVILHPLSSIGLHIHQPSPFTTEAYKLGRRHISDCLRGRHTKELIVQLYAAGGFIQAAFERSRPGPTIKDVLSCDNFDGSFEPGDTESAIELAGRHLHEVTRFGPWQLVACSGGFSSFVCIVTSWPTGPVQSTLFCPPTGRRSTRIELRRCRSVIFGRAIELSNSRQVRLNSLCGGSWLMSVTCRPFGPTGARLTSSYVST